jgi:benzodiazapine receptor
MNFIKRHLSKIIFSSIFLVLGMLSGILIKNNDMYWYKTLIKPAFNPPSIVFGPIWTALYIMLGIVFAMLWKNRNKEKKNIIIFLLQFAYNLAWSPLFFYFKRIDLAMYDISLILLTSIVFAVSIRKNQLMLVMFLPYLVWVSFATALNSRIYTLNC